MQAQQQPERVIVVMIMNHDGIDMPVAMMLVAMRMVRVAVMLVTMLAVLTVCPVYYSMFVALAVTVPAFVMTVITAMGAMAVTVVALAAIIFLIDPVLASTTVVITSHRSHGRQRQPGCEQTDQRQCFQCRECFHRRSPSL